MLDLAVRFAVQLQWPYCANHDTIFVKSLVPQKCMNMALNNIPRLITIKVNLPRSPDFLH